MKRPNYFKVLLLATSVTVILVIASCGDYQNPEDTKEISGDQNEAILESNNQENDAQFLVKAAEINLEEIQLGQLAQQKSETSHVMELGKMMEDAHSKSLTDLRDLAKNKMITIPNSPTDEAKDTYTKLNEKSGSDFDKAYSDMMVSGHKDAIEVFKKASTDCNDTDIKNWASATLPILQTHLVQSIECQRKCNINTKLNN